MSTHTPERNGDGMAPQWISHPSADTPDERHLGEFPEFDQAFASSIVRMDAAEHAADMLSKYAHLLPVEAQKAAQSWRLARGL